MIENDGYLKKLLYELKGVEANMQQLEGLVVKTAETGAIKKHEKYQCELTNLLSNRKDLIHSIEEAKKELH